MMMDMRIYVVFIIICYNDGFICESEFINEPNQKVIYGFEK